MPSWSLGCTTNLGGTASKEALILDCIILRPLHCLSVLPPALHTSDNELTLVLHSSSLVACDAGVVSIVHQGEVGDTQGACEIYVVYCDSQAGRDWSAILLPCDEDRLVARHDHTGDEHPLANGKPGKLKWVDGWWDWKR